MFLITSNDLHSQNSSILFILLTFYCLEDQITTMIQKLLNIPLSISKTSKIVDLKFNNDKEANMRSLVDLTASRKIIRIYGKIFFIQSKD